MPEELIEVSENREGRGLGFRHAVDDRDREYRVKPLVELAKAEEEVRTYRYWFDRSLFLDQGATPMCVGYSIMHFVEDGPITQYPKKLGSPPLVGPAWVYNEAQKVDEWPGTDYDGTSVRAGMKVLQRNGVIESYRWAFDLQTTIDTILYVSPVVIGVPWYYDMFFPNEEGVITATGSFAGGHAVVLNGVNVEKEMFRLKNSWGVDWGKKGRAYISFIEFEKLLNTWSEIAMPVEVEMPEGTEPFTMV